MATLPSTRFQMDRYPLDRSLNRNTFIEDEPQVETQPQFFSKPAAFNDLYDMSDDETDVIAIRMSNSLSAQPTPTIGKRFPSLVIPSPTAWPTIQNYQKKGVDAPMLSPSMISPAIVSPTPRMLSTLAARPMDNASSSAPSLDGSLTSEELSSLSCPSTPDLERREVDWSPVQLNAQALQTLHCITGNDDAEEPMLLAPQMKEVNEVPQLGLDISCVQNDHFDPNELSALSVPSPGGFFAALEPSSRHTWLPAPEDQPSTSIAERFYGVPWAENTTEQVIEYGDDNITEGPPTARRIALASPRSVTTARRTPSPQFATEEYKDNYVEELQAVGQTNFDRTSMWLQSQEVYIPDEVTCIRGSALFSPFSPTKFISPIEEVDEEEEVVMSPSKAVRFAEESPVKVESEQPVAVEKDDIFVQAIEHVAQTSESADAFVHRKTRTEKLRLDRKCLFTSHVNRLDAKYEIVAENQPRNSGIFKDEESDESQAIATALRERRALEQIKPVSWNLEATKMLNGGSLLTSPTGKLMPKMVDGRVLDLGGQASCDWAWQVAIEHPSSTVHTVFTADQAVDASIQGPTNHKQTKVPNLWTLPFPNNHFHLISARNLMSLLKTDKPSGKARDEYDLCLRECMRVLKPGGYLEFALLDADIVGGGNQSSATSVEFCFNLRTRGYDAAPTKVWLPRLRRAGFAQVRRAWLNLPLAQSSEKEGSTADASHISGLVGSWAWERWMLKLHKEMGREADRLLEGAPSALEDGAKTGASWRYLSGWARKPM